MPDLSIFLDTMFVEPLRQVAELPKVIDDSVTRLVDEPSSTVSVNERFYFGYSSKTQPSVCQSGAIIVRINQDGKGDIQGPILNVFLW